MATLDDALRQVHLGGRLNDDIEYSRRTLNLDTEANASALKDVVRHTMGPATVNSYNEAIRLAHEQKIDAKEAARLLKAHLNVESRSAAHTSFSRASDVICYATVFERRLWH
jgi:hypothetical protein